MPFAPHLFPSPELQTTPESDHVERSDLSPAGGLGKRRFPAKHRLTRPWIHPLDELIPHRSFSTRWPPRCIVLLSKQSQPSHRSSHARPKHAQEWAVPQAEPPHAPPCRRGPPGAGPQTTPSPDWLAIVGGLTRPRPQPLQPTEQCDWSTMHPNDGEALECHRYEPQRPKQRFHAFAVAQKATTEPNGEHQWSTRQAGRSRGHETRPSCTHLRANPYRQVRANPFNHLRFERIT